MEQNNPPARVEHEISEGFEPPVEPVMPLVSPEEARKQWNKFEALKAQLLDKTDYQKIAGKHFIKRSGFRKIAVYFGLSDHIQEQERVDRPDNSFYWRIVVRAEAPNGRTSIGVGICDSREKKYAHVEHDVYATAHTRAKSRAISDMVAGGVVSAEEMESPNHTTHNPYPQGTPENAKPIKTETKTKTKTQSESKTDLADRAIQARSDMKKYLESTGLNPAKVSILMTDDRLKVIEQDPNENWEKWTSVIEKYGGKWNPDENQWEVPLE